MGKQGSEIIPYSDSFHAVDSAVMCSRSSLFTVKAPE